MCPATINIGRRRAFRWSRDAREMVRMELSRDAAGELEQPDFLTGPGIGASPGCMSSICPPDGNNTEKKVSSLVGGRATTTARPAELQFGRGHCRQTQSLALGGLRPTPPTRGNRYSSRSIFRRIWCRTGSIPDCCLRLRRARIVIDV